MKCAVNGCKRKKHAKGWCMGHYMQDYQHGRIVSVKLQDNGRKGIWQVKMRREKCKVQGCDRIQKYQCGHCNTHYLQMHRHGRILWA